MTRQASDVQSQDALKAWMKDLRERAGLTQEQVAAAMGYDGEKGRRNILRWLSEDRGLTALNLLRYLSAVGVEMEPRPPEQLPKALNEELRLLREAVGGAASTTAELGLSVATIQDALDALLAERGLPPVARERSGND